VVARVERARAEEELRAEEESYRLLAEENERLYRQQLNIAEQLQQTLLHIPSEIGRVRLGHLYRSATETARVGGDFYDVFEAKDGQIAVLIGDVAGHGIQAARTGTLVKDVVHAFTHQSIRTHEVLRRTNQLLIEKDLSEFVTLFLGILDPGTGIMHYSSAGHPESMVKRVAGQIELLGCGTSPLGIYPDANWKPREISLAPGDLLLLYTDGVTEARRGLEMFGEKRLERLLKRKRISPGRLPHMILDQVLAFSGGSLRDDAAVLVLSLTEPPEGEAPRPAAQQTLLDV
jgi:serine phosphatase RsbU (regulator of sigma subunit)